MTKKNDFAFFAEAPAMNPNVLNITDIFCSYRKEEIDVLATQKLRYSDKLIDELANVKTML